MSFASADRGLCTPSPVIYGAWCFALEVRGGCLPPTANGAAGALNNSFLTDIITDRRALTVGPSHNYHLGCSEAEVTEFVTLFCVPGNLDHPE
jgi:hypothetical protein